MRQTWLITGISSGFGKALTEQLLAKGDTVIGTVRTEKDDIRALTKQYPDTLDVYHKLSTVLSRSTERSMF